MAVSRVAAATTSSPVAATRPPVATAMVVTTAGDITVEATGRMAMVVTEVVMAVLVAMAAATVGILDVVLCQQQSMYKSID